MSNNYGNASQLPIFTKLKELAGQVKGSVTPMRDQLVALRAALVEERERLLAGKAAQGPAAEGPAQPYTPRDGTGPGLGPGAPGDAPPRAS